MNNPAVRMGDSMLMAIRRWIWRRETLARRDPFTCPFCGAGNAFLIRGGVMFPDRETGQQDWAGNAVLVCRSPQWGKEYKWKRK
ncbi:MAG TPA: hypothetical protein DCE18_09735 [Syntrophobacteraceae bacterium]|jgi:hypothetical protein|nr:hypothetical protein [Syntrophobacteraceae bacterium]